MWTYEQLSGRLTSRDGILLGIAYSGHLEGKNNPAFENDPGIGPIPQGLWDIQPPHDTARHGPYVMRLDPRVGTETFGRAGFMIHGDSAEHPGQASEGCIAISPRDKRSAIWQSGDTLLNVISGNIQ